jgi:hypothetical protein
VADVEKFGWGCTLRLRVQHDRHDMSINATEITLMLHCPREWADAIAGAINSTPLPPDINIKDVPAAAERFDSTVTQVRVLRRATYDQDNNR